MTVELDLEEAKKILETATRLASPSFEISSQPIDTQIQAMAGVINVVRAMQALGYRVSRPLRAVK